MWIDAGEVAAVVDTLLFLGQVPGPVPVEVAAAGEGAELHEDGFGTVETPAGAGDVDAVLDEVAAGAFDHPRARGSGRRYGSPLPARTGWPTVGAGPVGPIAVPARRRR